MATHESKPTQDKIVDGIVPRYSSARLCPDQVSNKVIRDLIISLVHACSIVIRANISFPQHP